MHTCAELGRSLFPYGSPARRCARGGVSAGRALPLRRPLRPVLPRKTGRSGSPVLSCLPTGTAHNAPSRAQVPATPGHTARLPTPSQTDSCLGTVTNVNSESERPLYLQSHHPEQQTSEIEISVASPLTVLMILFLNRKAVFSGNNLSVARKHFINVLGFTSGSRGQDGGDAGRRHARQDPAAASAPLPARERGRRGGRSPSGDSDLCPLLFPLVHTA